MTLGRALSQCYATVLLHTWWHLQDTFKAVQTMYITPLNLILLGLAICLSMLNAPFPYMVPKICICNNQKSLFAIYKQICLSCQCILIFAPHGKTLKQCLRTFPSFDLGNEKTNCCRVFYITSLSQFRRTFEPIAAILSQFGCNLRALGPNWREPWIVLCYFYVIWSYWNNFDAITSNFEALLFNYGYFCRLLYA